MVHPENGLEPSKFHFVLVHGFESGAWSWYKVRTLLEASGFKVTCLDLKASGVDMTSVDSIRTFDSYTEPLTHFLAGYSPNHYHHKACLHYHMENDQVILVGHSAGGLSVTDATYKFSNKIHAAVYVAATMLKNGFSTEQDIIDGMPGQYKHTDVSQNIDPRIPPEDITLGKMLKRPGPLKAIQGAKFLGNDQVEQVPRIYIRTLQDQVLTPKQQEAMVKRWPPARIFALDTDHNPLVSAPFLLAGLLTKVVDESTIYREFH